MSQYIFFPTCHPPGVLRQVYMKDIYGRRKKEGGWSYRERKEAITNCSPGILKEQYHILIVAI